MPDLNNIPEAKTAEEIAALQASDPAAFDLDDVPEQTDDDKAAAELAEKEAADKAADEAAAKAEADKAEEAKKADVIPKGRFNEALRERDAERQRADALAAELAALKAGPAINYDEEITSLKEKWDNDEFEGTLDEFIAARDALLVQKTEADARAKFQQEQAERDVNAKLEAWDKDARSFVDSNERYKDEAELARLNEALAIQFARNPNGSHADWLIGADKHVQAMAIVEGRAQPAAAPAAATDPNAERNKADAQASAKASAAPKVVAGGVSSAGGPVGNIDMASLKPGQFSKLPKDQQEAALGGAGAL